jgi:hypothetical protein
MEFRPEPRAGPVRSAMVLPTCGERTGPLPSPQGCCASRPRFAACDLGLAVAGPSARGQASKAD